MRSYGVSRDLLILLVQTELSMALRMVTLFDWILSSFCSHRASLHSLAVCDTSPIHTLLSSLVGYTIPARWLTCPWSGHELKSMFLANSSHLSASCLRNCSMKRNCSRSRDNKHYNEISTHRNIAIVKYFHRYGPFLLFYRLLEISPYTVVEN